MKRQVKSILSLLLIIFTIIYGSGFITPMISTTVNNSPELDSKNSLFDVEHNIQPIKSEFPISTASTEISHITVPLVTDNPEEKCPLVEKSLDIIKNHFEAGKHSIVLKITEEEEVDKGWFSHTDLSGGYSFEKGDINFKVKSTPKKIKRKKKTTIEVDLKEKDK